MVSTLIHHFQIPVPLKKETKFLKWYLNVRVFFKVICKCVMFHCIITYHVLSSDHNSLKSALWWSKIQNDQYLLI